MPLDSWHHFIPAATSYRVRPFFDWSRWNATSLPSDCRPGRPKVLTQRGGPPPPALECNAQHPRSCEDFAVFANAAAHSSNLTSSVPLPQKPRIGLHQTLAKFLVLAAFCLRKPCRNTGCASRLAGSTSREKSIRLGPEAGPRPPSPRPQPTAAAVSATSVSRNTESPFFFDTRILKLTTTLNEIYFPTNNNSGTKPGHPIRLISDPNDRF